MFRIMIHFWKLLCILVSRCKVKDLLISGLDTFFDMSQESVVRLTSVLDVEISITATAL